jgi:ABC-type polysaccharide/polyol phosphate transport system ATPase subunit
MNAVELRSVSKRYSLVHRPAYGTLADAFGRVGRRRAADSDELWALREIDLEERSGQALGFVGRYGAGKSTLLKVIARITRPTEGRSRTRGRVASLLEVGTGFHLELTGRENVYLNGAILGMSRLSVARQFDQIVEFAGTERFVDTPLKWYSSGMQMRLAFAVAAHLEAEIMVVDEVLAVGDAEFQRRCLGKMSEIATAGRTVLFVSHDTGAITRLCERAIWIERGAVQRDAAAGEVVGAYLAAASGDKAMVELDDHAGPVRMRSARIVDADGATAGALPRGDEISVEVAFDVVERFSGLDLALSLLGADGTIVLDETWSDEMPAAFQEPGPHLVRLTIPGMLVSGDYTWRLWVGTNHEQFLLRDLMTMTIAPRAHDPADAVQRRRIVQPGARWQASR